MADKFQLHRRWLLFLLHARTCKQPGVKCPGRNCVTVQKLLSHMNSCVEPQCLYPRCRPTKLLISHHEACKDLRCPVCVQVNTYVQQEANVRPMAGLKIKSSKVDKARVLNDSVRASAHCADTSDSLKLREGMRTPVFSELQKLNPCAADDDASMAKYLDETRSLEESLYQTANTKENCINPPALEFRLSSLIKRIKLNGYKQIQQNVNSSPPETMITTTAPDVSVETTMMEIEKVPENGDQLEIRGKRF